MNPVRKVRNDSITVTPTAEKQCLYNLTIIHYFRVHFNP